jgi:DNA repair protein RecN (Recombination protein N)
MLSFLKIENLAIVPSLSVEFAAGFNVLTGETGAGKSIIVDAVGLLLGERGSAGLIRTGADHLTVEGLFETKSRKGLCERLEEIEVDVGEEGIILRRELADSGRSRAFINGRLVPLQHLKQVGDLLADLHGQNPHQSLLRPEGQREALDRFASAGNLAAKVESAAKRLRELLGERETLRSTQQEHARLADALRAEVAEIEAAAPSSEEEADLRREEMLLRHAEEIRSLAAMACDLLNENDDSALSRLGAIRGALEKLAAIDARCLDALRAVEESVVSLNEALRTVEPYREQGEYDPARLDHVASRLAAIDRLKKKYGSSIDEILVYLGRARADLRALESSVDRLEAIDEEVAAAARTYAAAADNLSRKRREGARELERALQEELKALALHGCRFKVAFEPHEDPDSEVTVRGRRMACRRHGIESVEFLISPNPGEDLRPLSQIASGGELSRLMLALRTASESRTDARALIFDEVDSGIGGAVAEAVALRLKGLARRQQVLCVTHLPQVAAVADRHYRVEKETVKGRTRTAVSLLQRSERVEELARMLGSPRAPTARKHAAALISGRSQR